MNIKFNNIMFGDTDAKEFKISDVTKTIKFSNTKVEDPFNPGDVTETPKEDNNTPVTTTVTKAKDNG